MDGFFARWCMALIDVILLIIFILVFGVIVWLMWLAGE